LPPFLKKVVQINALVTGRSDPIRATELNCAP
jgi:hypothetical protein